MCGEGEVYILMDVLAVEEAGGEAVELGLGALCVGHGG